MPRCATASASAAIVSSARARSFSATLRPNRSISRPARLQPRWRAAICGEFELPPQLGIVSPVYRAEVCIEELHRRLTSVLQGMQVDYEIILVDDGSPDRSGEKLEQIA